MDNLKENKEIDEFQKTSTISTKLSTDHLICKSPLKNIQEAPKSSLDESLDSLGGKNHGGQIVFYLGALQCVFGVLMIVCGGLVLQYDASLAKLGGGIWGGFLAVATGTTGLLIAQNKLGPLTTNSKKITHTLFLALSLISLAISQLVVALAATGVGRDINKAQDEIIAQMSGNPSTIINSLPINHLSVLSNLALIIVSMGEFVIAAISSFTSSRQLCPCFQNTTLDEDAENSSNNKNSLVSSWLGKHNLPAPLYIVPNQKHDGKLYGNLEVSTPAPRRIIKPMLIQHLIPAPLGSIPSPIIPPTSYRRRMIRGGHKRKTKQSNPNEKSQNTSESIKTTKPITIDLKYTGLDKTIAEEFIEYLDSKHTSLCSESSSDCYLQSSSNSDVASEQQLVVISKT